MAETQAEENAKDEHGQQPSADDSEQSQLSESSDLVTQLTKIQPLLPPIVSSADCGSQSASALSNELIKMGAITPFVLPTNPSGHLANSTGAEHHSHREYGVQVGLEKDNVERSKRRIQSGAFRRGDFAHTRSAHHCIGVQFGQTGLHWRQNGGYVLVGMPQIQNMVASFDMRFPVHLERLCVAHAQFCTYEPELFAGLVYRMVHPRVVLLIFVSGKGVIMGAKERKDFDEAFTNISPILNGFRKQ